MWIFGCRRFRGAHTFSENLLGAEKEACFRVQGSAVEVLVLWYGA